MGLQRQISKRNTKSHLSPSEKVPLTLKSKMSKEVSWKPKSHVRRVNRRPDNPFQEPSASDVYAQQAESARRKKEDWKAIKRMNIADRALINAPKTSHRTLRRNIEHELNHDAASRDDEIKPVSEIRQRQRHATHLIQEQKEVFLSNLLISHHEKELGRIKYQKDAKEAKLEAVQLDNKELQNRVKTTTNQYESMRTRIHQRLEEQTRKRKAIENEVKQRTRSIDSMQSEISKLEETVHQYEAYETLLRDIEKTYGKKPESTSELLDFFERLENDSLFIVKNIERFKTKEEESKGDIEAEEARILQQIAEIDAEMASCQDQMTRASECKEKVTTNAALDQSIAQLQKSIGKIFKACYPQSDSTQTPLTMLGLLESKLDEMSRDMAYIDPAFIAKKTKQLVLEKRTRQREANTEMKNRENSQKFKQMMERATRPVKRGDGRPVTARVIPARATKKNSEELERQQLEKERIDELLYGPIFS